jgi:hypothetical protein
MEKEVCTPRGLKDNRKMREAVGTLWSATVMLEYLGAKARRRSADAGDREGGGQPVIAHARSQWERHKQGK